MILPITVHIISAHQTWDLRHRVMWPNKELHFIKLPQDEKGVHFGLKKDGKLISVVSLFIENESAQFRKFATETAEQGKGHGTQLLQHIMEYAQQQRLEKIWCNARVEKTSFYERFGMRKTNKWFSRGEIDYIVMERVLNMPQ